MTPPWLRDLAMLTRLTRDLRPFVRTPINAETAMEVVRSRLAAREDRFLRMAEQAIFEHPQSPYLQLLREAGCEFGDLKALVTREGVDGTLSRLLDAGVYLSYDEFKGRKEVLRGGRRFAFREDDFDHPHLSPHFEARSGGTRGRGTVVKKSLQFIADLAANSALAIDAQGISRYKHVIWLIAGVTPTLLYAKLGRPPISWFYPVKPLPLKMQAGSRYLAALSRLLPSRFPTPRFLDLQDPGQLAAWLTERLDEGEPVCVTTYASSAVRVCAAAGDKGLSLDGVCFITLGEPFTAAKQRAVAAVGARALVRYAFTEAGIIGYGCANARLPDDLHFFEDCYALTLRARKVVESGPSVDAFLFTSLLPTAPKVLLNVESGDYGVLERRACGCKLDTAGLRTHLALIRSFEKLTGEGMTFVQTDLLRVIEETLPVHFGGASSDYQIIEEEGEDGILKLSLIVSPGIGPVDAERMRHTFLEELGRDGGFTRLQTELWRRAGTIQVKRQWPVATKAGKILPFHVVGRTA